MFQLRQSILLFITASIWGSGFVAQSIGMDHVEPFTFTFFRTAIGGFVLIPVIWFLNKLKQRGGRIIHNGSKKDLFWGSFFCGMCLVAAESFQQFGLVYTDAGKAGFITSMYIIFVPILSIFLAKKVGLSVWIGVILSVFGLYFLCIKPDMAFSIEKGDFLIFICAIIFAVHILVIAYFVNKVDGVELACGQFFAGSFVAFFLMLIHDTITYEGLMGALPAILWVGIMSNGVAYTLQIVGQRGMNPTISTLILSLESVMAVVFGGIFLREVMSSRKHLGGALMLAAVIIAQIPPKKAKVS